MLTLNSLTLWFNLEGATWCLGRTWDTAPSWRGWRR